MTSQTIESQVASLYQELLSLPESFDHHAPFVQLGGQSATAARLQIRIMQVFHLRIPFADLYRNSDVVSLSALVASRLESEG